MFLIVISIVIISVNTVYANKEAAIVVLLHGLARSDASFKKMEKSLKDEGYNTCNISYPSTRHSIEVLASKFVLPEIKRCLSGENISVNFVTHSMGGILVRYLATQKVNFNFGKVVMLSPPNKGSEIVDELGGLWLFKVINGPAGLELSTNNESMPNILGPAAFELGIITRNKSIKLTV